MKSLTVKLTFLEPMLGTNPNDEDIYRNYIVGKAREAGADISPELEQEELDSLPLDNESIEKGMTVFKRTEDGKPAICGYHIKGFFKDSAKMLKKVPKTESSKVKAYKQEIDGLIFIDQELIPIEGGELSVCQRPLRASTPMGERIALSMSEQISRGCTVTFEITTLRDDYLPWIRELLDYGKMRGIGQWRNSGKGRFTWEELSCV